MTTTSSLPFSFPFDKEVLSRFSPFVDSAGTFARGAYEATSASTRASMKGMQEVGQTMVAQLKDQVSLTVETGKKLTEARSFDTAMSIQSDYVKSAFEKNVKNFNDLSDLYTDTLIEALAPITQQVKKANKSGKSA